MHGGKKSDPPIVAKKPTNNAAPAAAEPAEPRGGTKGNAGQQSTPRTQSRTSVSPALDRVRQAARERPKEQLTALSHHVTVDLLQAAYAALRREAAPGADGVTWSTYGENLEANLLNLHQRVHRGAYRAQPSRRRYIPKSDGKMRPLGIASLEDKIVQKAVVEILNAIYEEEFLGVRFVKADVEGNEREVLDGARATIARDRPIILVELLSGTYEEPAADTAAICESFGYEAFIVQRGEKIAALPRDRRPRQEYELGNRHRVAERPIPAAMRAVRALSTAP
jgi:FkbM family methyltransferase